MDANDQKLRLLQIHREFLEFPQTHLVLSKLDNFRLKLINQAETLSLKIETQDDARVKLIEANNIKRILSHIRDPEKFVSLNNS